MTMTYSSGFGLVNIINNVYVPEKQKSMELSSLPVPRKKNPRTVQGY